MLLTYWNEEYLDVKFIEQQSLFIIDLKFKYINNYKSDIHI